MIITAVLGHVRAQVRIISLLAVFARQRVITFDLALLARVAGSSVAHLIMAMDEVADLIACILVLVLRRHLHRQFRSPERKYVLCIYVGVAMRFIKAKG